MNKKQLENYIVLYNNVEKEYKKFKESHFQVALQTNKFYESYNYIIHKLLEYEFGYNNTDLLEHYIWNQIELSFDELCKKLNITDGTNTK